ncbi:MAG TPA: DUF554 domain-containing protein [Patescibacteria group bacterium]|nr:DUF554 domain-containing protein [Patescibacteria group bacterium]
MKGTLTNAATILIGSAIGLALKRVIPEKCLQTIMQGMSLAVLVIGFQMAERSQNFLVVILALAGGALIGELLDIDGRLTKLGDWLTHKWGQGERNLGKGFVNASLLFCIGAMAVVGAIQEGLTGSTDTLYAKATLDGIVSVLLAATLGIGVALSSISVLLYQGSITLASGLIGSYASDAVVREVSATGGVLIIGVGVVMIELKEIKLANLLPAIPVAAVIAFFWNL